MAVERFALLDFHRPLSSRCILGLTLGAPLTPNCFPMEMLIVVGLERLAAFGEVSCRQQQP
jgi:hypothetical protein